MAATSDSSSGAYRAPVPSTWSPSDGRLTWAGAHRLSLPCCVCLASSAGSLSLFRVGIFLQSGGPVPWQRTSYLRPLQTSQMDREPHDARKQGSLKPQSQPISSLQGLSSQWTGEASGSFKQGSCLGTAWLLKPHCEEFLEYVCVCK